MHENIEASVCKFEDIHSALDEIAQELECQLIEFLSEDQYIDKISTRVKSINSFRCKISRIKNDELKYKVPLKEVQDQIGARIVVYYKDVAESIYEKLQKCFNIVEATSVVPDEPSQFGYEGLHLICFIPSIIINKYKTSADFPDFFELQIKTLFQHAWGQTEHGLGYKPDKKLLSEEKRKLAFIAAQSWGADTILSELYKSNIKGV